MKNSSNFNYDFPSVLNKIDEDNDDSVKCVKPLLSKHVNKPKSLRLLPQKMLALNRRHSADPFTHRSPGVIW